MKSEQTLASYCEEKGIGVYTFARKAGISNNRMRQIKDDRNAGLNIDTINKIYHTSALLFGEGLAVEDYLNIYKD